MTGSPRVRENSVMIPHRCREIMQQRAPLGTEAFSGQGETPQTWWRGWIVSGHLATTFLLRLPFPQLTRHVPPGALTRAMWIFPLIGACVGGTGAAVYAVAVILGFTQMVAAVLTIAAITWLTGGLHEDGLADMADTFGVTGPRVQKLAVMRDSHIGTFGVLALVFVTSMRILALFDIGTTTGILRVTCALVLAESLGRAAMPLAMWLAPPARTDGLGATAAAAKDKEIFFSMIISMATACIMALTILHVLHVLILIITVYSVVYLILSYACHHLGGHTGDVLGATGHTVGTTVLVCLTVCP